MLLVILQKCCRSHVDSQNIHYFWRIRHASADIFKSLSNIDRKVAMRNSTSTYPPVLKTIEDCSEFFGTCFHLKKRLDYMKRVDGKKTPKVSSFLFSIIHKHDP